MGGTAASPLGFAAKPYVGAAYRESDRRAAQPYARKGIGGAKKKRPKSERFMNSRN